MKKLLTQLLPLLLVGYLSTSCGKILDKGESDGGRQFQTTDAEFDEYIKSFEADGREFLNDPDFSIGDVPVNFGDTTNESYDGVCLTYTSGEKEIIISKTWWDRADINKREVMVHHELGHCVLGREHNDTILTAANGTVLKESIMNSFLPSGRAYELYREEYLTELFKSDTSEIHQAIGAKN